MDGNCQFRAVADQMAHVLPGDPGAPPRGHAYYRALAVDTMVARGWDDATDAVPVARLRRDGEWGDGRTLQALAVALGVNVRVHDTRGHVFTVECAADQTPRATLHVRYAADAHYDSLREV
jgi:hypothetical protein